MSIKRMRLRYAGTCSCGADVPAGAQAGWDRDAKAVVCQDCLTVGSASVEVARAEPEIEAHPDPVQPGAAGASLRREYERRKTVREQRIREKHKNLGGLILAVSNEPATTRAFATGADGEERLAARLERDCGSEVLFLHNRKLGRGRRDGDIDHVAVAASGIYVIDAKRYPNARVRVRRSGGILSPVREQLMVAGRDRTKLLAGCAKQLAAVEAALAVSRLDPQPVVPLLCFVDADLPLFSSMEIGGVRLLGPRAVVRALLAQGEISTEQRRAIHGALAIGLPSA